MVAYIIWIVALLILLPVMQFTNSWILTWLYYVVAALSLAAIIVTRRPIRLLSASRRLRATHCEIGEPVTVEVLANWEQHSGQGWVLIHDNLPPSFRVLNPCGRLFIANSASNASFSYRVVGPTRGYFPIGPLIVTTGDFFGILQKKTENASPGFLTVYPRVCPVAPFFIPSNRPIGEVASRKKIFEDTTRIVGVRDYQPGDTFSKIHWKTTARTGTLTTKLCESSTSIEVNIVLNLHYGDYPPREYEFELACTTAASIADDLLRDKHAVGLLSNGCDAAWQYNPSWTYDSLQVKSGKGSQQRAGVMSLLGRLQMSTDRPLAEYLTKMHSNLPWTSTTLLISHFINEEGAAAVEALKRAGLEVAVIIVGYGEWAEASLMRIAAAGIPAAIVRTEKELAYFEFWRPGR